MVIGKMRRAFNKSLSIAMAAAVMATSVPQFSVTAMAQEEGLSVQEETTDQSPSEVTGTDEAENKDSKGGNSAQEGTADVNSAQEDAESKTDEEEDNSDEPKKDEEDNSDEERDPESGEEDSDNEENSETEEDMDGEGRKKSGSEGVEEEVKLFYASAQSIEETAEGKLIYENDFDSWEDGASLAGGTVRQLADGNMAVEYDIDFTEVTEWQDIFQADLSLSPSYDDAIAEKMTMSYDVYFPNSMEDGGIGDIGTMKAKAVLKIGDDWAWTEGGSRLFTFGTSDLVSDEVSGYSKLHIEMDLSDETGWDVKDITSIKSIVPCLAGDVSTYKGRLYLDNVMLQDTSDSSAGEISGDDIVIYENDFNSETEDTELASGAVKQLVDGNMAVMYNVDLSESTGWTNIFQADLSLSEPYDASGVKKINMSYDVYFPNSINVSTIGTMKAQGVLRDGDNWNWRQADAIPAYDSTDLTAGEMDGYEKLHISIDIEGGSDWDFADLEPLKAVTPCLAGDISTYSGELYLDNVIVKAVNESESDLPVVEGDMVLELDASAWEVTAGYQYTTENSTVRNETIGGKKYLAVTVDYSDNTDKNWSEAKFDYTHPESVETLRGYNAFKADIYYKPANMSAGSFGVKIFSNSPAIENDNTMPEGEPVTIEGLEGYYKAEYELTLRISAGEFSGLTLGLVGKNTDYAGDIYFDNMRFTQVTEEDIYVDSTILPVKGAGIEVVDGGRSIKTASGQTVAIAGEVALVDADAIEETKNLYAYLKAVGESDSVIFGHQNDTHHKAGSAGDGFSSSDTEDITGSIAGVVGLDTLSLTGNEASTWDTPEEERIANAANITREAAQKGALITLSAHMPNFDLIDQRVKAYEASGGVGSGSDSVGYWEAADGSRQYNFSGYTPGTLTGNVVTRIMPGQDLNYLYTDYLDLIADYAKVVEDDGITILFRPLHENTGSWFWWGAALCDEQAYINLYRYTVDYLKETKDVHNILYVYGPGSEAGNAAEYGARYPGDDYVDMIGYDMYHSSPSPENEAAYLQNIKRQNAILREFAAAHNKLYAITETGVADKNASGADVALQRSGNQVMDWYMQLLDALDDEGVSYFLVWANFSDNGSFYTPYVVEKLDNGYLHGHEMLDEFIEFYNDGRSVFAMDMNSGFKQVQGVTNTTKENAVVSGYIIAPLSGDRILPDEQNSGTRIAAKIAGIDPAAVGVYYVVTTEYDEDILEASYNEKEGVWEAVLPDSSLESMGVGIGTITLFVGDKELSAITAKFNMVEEEQNDLIPDNFEGYNGDSQQLGLAWATNKDTGSEITLSLTDDKEKVFGGDYGLQMDVMLLSSSAWAGATKSFEADWSAGNALEFYTVPEPYGQKIVVQVTCGGNVFEVYLQEYENYTVQAEKGIPVKVTIPFSAFIGRDNQNAKFDPNNIESIGLWCNAIAGEGVSFPLNTTLYYDEIKVVNTDQETIQIEATVKEGIWFKEIPDQIYTGKAIKPEVQVYDGAKLLTIKKDYTVSYSNNTKAGSEAKIVIKGKGNYNQNLEGYFVIEPKALGATTITAPEYLIYNGREQAISVTVKDGKKKLSSKNDYTQVITYNGQTVTKAREAGTYQITITGKGNYKGTTDLTCQIVENKQLLSKASVKLPSSSLPYRNGESVTFDNESQIVVKLGGKVVNQQEADGTVNYEISYRNNKLPGTAAVVITAGKDSGYVGSCSKSFTIKGTAFSAKTINISGFETKLTYTGKSVFQNVVLTDKASGDKLQKNVDYAIAYQNYVNAGKATMTITGRGKYSGTIKKTYTIAKANLTLDMVGVKTIEIEQNRAGATPDVTIIYLGSTLVKDQDYKLTYSGNKNITTESKKAYVNIVGKGNYTGSLKKAVELKINPKSWQSSDITVGVPDMKYSSSKGQYKPNPVVCDNGAKLVKNKDYTVTYESNTKADVGDITQKPEGHVAKAVITLKSSDYVAKTDDEGNENTERVVEFRIIGQMISDAKVEIISPQYFDQQGTYPTQSDLKVTYKGSEVSKDNYEIIDYSKNTAKGKAVLVIQGKNQYGGTKKVTFTIKAKGIYDNWADKVAQALSNMMELFR